MALDVLKLDLKEAGKLIDTIAASASPLVETKMSGFAEALELAEAIGQLRELFLNHPGIKTRVQSFQDSRLGFLTDRSPSAIARAEKENKKMSPYPWPVIAECCIEALLQKLRITGNEFNIIAGGMYPAKNGKWRKIVEHPEVTDFKFTTSSPLYQPDGKFAKVQCYASWLQGGKLITLGTSEKDKGKEDTLIFTIRVNQAMGEDAVVGKAISKLFSRVLMRLSGKVMPESTDLEYGDVGAIPEPGAQAPAVTLTPVEPIDTEPERPTLTSNPPGTEIEGEDPAQKAEASGAPTEEELREQVTALAGKAGIPAEASEIFEGRYIEDKKVTWKKTDTLDTLALIVEQSEFVVADMKIKWNKWQREIQEYLNTLKTGQSNGDYDAVLAKEYISKRGNGYAEWVRANLARIPAMPSKNQSEIREKWDRIMKNAPFPEPPKMELKAEPKAEENLQAPAKKPWKVPTLGKQTFGSLPEAVKRFDELIKELGSMDNPKFTVESFTAWLDKELTSRNGQYKNLDHFKAATMVHGRFETMIDKFLQA